ncbi:MAG: hypothetical protein J1F35_05320 [Erysipelotrichales bacterium]|nr:hypothetical protein [Erysipelotrichales bacterium]
MNNQENPNNVEQTQVDPRTVNAEVIGELRKDKIGRPILVIQMFIIFGIVLIGLPIVNSLMNNQSSFLYKIFNPNTAIIEPPTSDGEEKEEFLNASEEQPLLSGTSMKYENIVMENFSLAGNYITFDIYSYNGVLNLDKEPCFLEVYSASSSNLIATVKLTGTYDNQKQRVSLTAYGLSFNGNYAYVGKVVEMDYSDYPAHTINSDESGIGSMTCIMDNRTLEYTFKNNYLIGIKDSMRVYLKDQKDDTAYLNLKGTYETKATNLGETSFVEEVSDGFVFNASIDLENMKVPSSIIDYDYYELDTESKVIYFTLRGKGFDCK